MNALLAVSTALLTNIIFFGSMAFVNGVLLPSRLEPVYAVTNSEVRSLAYIVIGVFNLWLAAKTYTFVSPAWAGVLITSFGVIAMGVKAGILEKVLWNPYMVAGLVGMAFFAGMFVYGIEKGVV